jgi:hypothetical protein
VFNRSRADPSTRTPARAGGDGVGGSYTVILSGKPTRIPTCEPEVTAPHVVVSDETGLVTTVARAFTAHESTEVWRTMLRARYAAARASSKHVKAFEVVVAELRLLALAATGDDAWLDAASKKEG